MMKSPCWALWAEHGWSTRWPTLPPGCILPKIGVNVLLANERSELRYLVPGRELILQRRDWKYLSLFPMEDRLTGRLHLRCVLPAGKTPC